MSEQNSSLNARALLRAFLVFVAGFLLTAFLMHLFVRDSIALYGSERSEKLEMLRRSGYSYSSAIFGSSHINEGFDPRSFDLALAGTPLGVHTFNLGISGGAQVEQRVVALYFLEHLKLPPADTPCFVMLEETAPATFSLPFVSHPRQVNILDWRSERIGAHFPLGRINLVRRLHLEEAEWESAFYHAVNLGMVSNKVFRPPFDEAQITRELSEDRRGLSPAPSDAEGLKDLQRSFGNAVQHPVAIRTSLNQGELMLLDDLEHARNGSQVQFAWVLMPRLDDLVQYRILPESQATPQGEVPILNLARPDLYPQFYVPSLWSDNQHLSAAGARLVSAALADALLSWAKNHPIHQNCAG